MIDYSQIILESALTDDIEDFTAWDTPVKEDQAGIVYDRPGDDEQDEYFPADYRELDFN